MTEIEVITLAESLLPKIKIRLGLDNEANDETLIGYICDVIHELIYCGVNDEVINSSISLGAINKGVKDTWNYNGGSESSYSHDFYDRAERLRRK